MHCTHIINKRIAAVLLTVLVLSAVTVSAHAEVGQAIGNFSPEGITGSQTISEAEIDTSVLPVELSNGVTYDPASDLFYREVEGGTFGISVPDGAILTGAVSAELSPSLTGTLYKNGTALDEPNLSSITEPGKYVFAVSANEVSQTVRVSFTIVTSPTSIVKEYTMPQDFFVVSATLNGEKTSYTQTYVDMSSDGDYVIDYRSPEANKDMQLAVTIDHTPPTVTLSGIVDGKANEPVTVSDIEDGATLYLERNSQQVTYTNPISQTGSYVLTVRDRAGNETVYDFAVVTYANNSLKILIGSCIVLVLALIGYLIYYRKYIRVS